MKRVYSFDIFDTCLGRICGAPKNIFDILAIKVLGKDSDYSQRCDFRIARIRGELVAAERVKDRGVTIDDIYANIDFSALTSMINEDIKLLELMTEEENLFAIYETKCRVKAIHDQKDPVIFISDMYLPSSFLIKILKREGFWEDGDQLYVSCEHSATKSEGNLYDVVKKREKISAFSWKHLGDNIWSDFIRPLRMGILSKRFRCGYSIYERLFTEKSLALQSQIGTIAPAISRSIVSGEPNNSRVLFCADIIAPIYVSFVFRTLLDAQKRGIKGLYFLSRDGYVFYKISEVFKKIFPSVECHYLYVSRKSLYLPSLDALDKASIESVLMKSRTIEECTDALQIEFSADEIVYLKRATSIIDGIMSSESILSRLKEHWASQKQACIEYFIQEGLASKNADSAIVDLRGSRKSQISINTILRRNGFPTVYAYYLEVTKDRKISNDYYSSEFYADNVSKKPSFSSLPDGKDILEHYFSITPFKRTSHYFKSENGITPVFDTEETVNSEAELMCRLNERVCVEYARRLLLVECENEIPKIIEPGLAVFSSFIQYPNRKYLKALLHVNTSQTQFAHRSLVGTIGLRTFFRKTVCWYEGSFKYTYGPLGLWLYKNILSKCVRVFLKR